LGRGLASVFGTGLDSGVAGLGFGGVGCGFDGGVSTITDPPVVGGVVGGFGFGVGVVFAGPEVILTAPGGSLIEGPPPIIFTAPGGSFFCGSCCCGC